MGANEGEWEAGVERLYEAVGREDELAQALGALRPAFGARSVSYLSIADPREPRGAFIGAIGISNDALVEYHSHFSPYDEWAKAVWVRNGYVVGATYRGSELAPQQALQASYFGREFLAKHGVADILSCVIEAPGDSGPATVLTFHRGPEQPLFEEAAVARLAALAPHLRRVLRLHRRLAPQLAIGATLGQLFRDADVPLLFIGRDGTVIEHNPAAQAVFAAAEPLLKLRAGRLMVATADGWQGLAPRLAALEDGPAPAFSVDLATGHGAAATLELRRVHGAATDRLVEHRAVAVGSLRPGPRAGGGGRAWRRFGLTPMEARVAEALAAGQAPNAVAAALDVRLSTVRTHVRSLFAKTGAKRLAELVAILHGR